MFLQSAISPGKIGVLTHSSYWNFYNKVKQLQKEGSLEGTTESKIKMDAQLISPQVRIHVPISANFRCLFSCLSASI